jgi:hypothetical protein
VSEITEASKLIAVQSCSLLVAHFCGQSSRSYPRNADDPVAEVAGIIGDNHQLPQVVVWDNGVPTKIADHGSPASIDDIGQVVGYDSLGDGSLVAVEWSGGQVIDLWGVSGLPSQALDINDAGQVVGYMTVPFTPGAPEPSTLAMMLLGFAGLGLAGFRRRVALIRA